MNLLLDVGQFAVLALAAAVLVGLFHRAGFTFAQRQIPRPGGVAGAAVLVIASVFLAGALELQNSRAQFLKAVDCADPRADSSNCIARTDAGISDVQYYYRSTRDSTWAVSFANGLPRAAFGEHALAEGDLRAGQAVVAHVWGGKVASITFAGRTVASQEMGSDSLAFTIPVFFALMVVGGAIVDAYVRLNRGRGVEPKEVDNLRAVAPAGLGSV